MAIIELVSVYTYITELELKELLSDKTCKLTRHLFNIILKILSHLKKKSFTQNII